MASTDKITLPQIGDLNNLNTSVKTDLVSAINEVNYKEKITGIGDISLVNVTPTFAYTGVYQELPANVVATLTFRMDYTYAFPRSIALVSDKSIANVNTVLSMSAGIDNFATTTLSISTGTAPLTLYCWASGGGTGQNHITRWGWWIQL